MGRTSGVEPRAGPLKRARPEWAYALLVSFVSLTTLAGTVVLIDGGMLEYQDSVVMLSALCASLLFVSLLFRPDALRLDRRAVPSLVFATVAILSVIASPGFTSALARLELYYSIFIVGLAVRLALPHSAPGTGNVVLLTIAVVHAWFLLLAVQFAMAAAGTPEPVGAPPYFLNVRHFGYQGFFGASAAVAVALLDKRLRSAGVLLATAALFGIIMFGSRGALLAWVLFAVAALVLVPDRRKLAGVSLAAITGAFALAVVAEWYGWLNTYSLIDRSRTFVGDTPSLLYTLDRIAIWRDSLATIAQRPLLGYGPEGYQISRCCNRMFAQPHNSILQFLLEFGVIGVAALAWAVIALFGPRVRTIVLRTARQHRNTADAVILAIVIGFTGFSLIDGLLYHPIPLINFALVAAILLAGPSAGATSPAYAPDRAPTRSPAS